MPDDTHIDLSERVAALEQMLVERTAERDASLAREAALAEVLDAINRSPGDPGPVFEAILEKAHSLCGAATGGLVIYDGEHFRAVATHGYPEELAAMVRRPYLPTVSHQRLIDGERFVHHPDLKAVESAPDHEVQRGIRELTAVRTQLLMSLRKDGALLGLISAGRREVRPFSEKEIALLESFAAQAVIAIENTRLLTELRESLEQQTATAEVLQVINSSPGELQPVFEAILEKAHTHCGATRGTLFLFDGETFRGVAMHSYPQDMAEQWRRGISVRETSVWEPLLAGAPFSHITDFRLIDDPIARAAAERGGVRTSLLLALRKEGALLGVITCTRGEVRPFSEKEIAFLENFAAQAVIAMDNARLLGELRERTRELEESLEYQTATSDVLNVISRSTADVQPVLDTVVETATRLCGADVGSILIRDGEVYRYASSSYSASDPEFWAIERQRTIVPGPNNVTGRVVREGKVVHIADIRDIPDYAVPEAVTAGRRTALGVPLLRDGEPIGVIVLNRLRV